MLTRKDYEAIAHALGDAGCVPCALADYFASDNPRFDRARFMRAARTPGTTTTERESAVNATPEPHRIPGLSEDTDTWSLLNVLGADLPRVLLYGPPGTGKTYVAMHAGLKPGQGAARVVFTEDTPAAELRGHYIPKGSEWVWQDGPAITCYRYGGRFVADEITRATDDALSFMLGILDGLPLTLPNGETISPHPEFSVWATTNDDPGSLTDALADRFVVRVKADKVNPAALATLPSDISRAVSTGTGGISMREGQEFERLYEKTGIPSIAAHLIWGDRAFDVLTGFDIAHRLDSGDGAYDA